MRNNSEIWISFMKTIKWYIKKCILESYKYGRIKNHILAFDFVLLLLDWSCIG